MRDHQFVRERGPGPASAKTRRRTPEGARDEQFISHPGAASQDRAASGTLTEDRDRDRHVATRARSPPTIGQPVTMDASAIPRCNSSRSVPAAPSPRRRRREGARHGGQIRDRGGDGLEAEVL